MSNENLHVVFGTTGSIGSAVIRELIKKGLNVRGVSRSGKADVPESVEMVAADAFDLESMIKAMEGASVVYHCLGVPYTKWLDMLPKMMDIFIEAVQQTGVKMVYADNTYMYGLVTTPLTEDLPNASTGRKGKVRGLLADLLLKAHREGKIKATIGRGTDIYGPGALNSILGDRVIPKIVLGKKISLLGKLDIPRDYIYVDDLAKGLVTLGTHDMAYGEIWHLPNAETLTQRQLLELFYQEAGFDPKIGTTPSLIIKILGLIVPIMRELKEMLYEYEEPFVIDYSKYQAAFGSDITPHKEAVKHTLDWFQTNYS